MILQLIEKAETKAGTQQNLAKRFNMRYNRFADYKAGRRIPDDALIGELAEYVGLNPIETILQCKLETDKEKATLWQAWLSKIVVRSAGLEPTPQASETYFAIFVLYAMYRKILNSISSGVFKSRQEVICF